MIKKLFADCLHSILYKIKKQGFTLAEALIITVMTGVCLLPIMGTMQNAQVRTENYDHQSKMQLYARSRLTAEIANAAFDHRSIDLEDEYHYIVYFDENGDSDEAKEIELVKTSIKLEDLKLLNGKEVKNWSDEACRVFGLKKAGNSHQPYLNVIHAYKTSVETKDNPILAEFGDDLKTVETPKALLGIVVKTCLLYSNEQYYHETDGFLKIDPPLASEDGTTIDKDTTTQIVPVTLFAFVNLPTVSDEMIWLADAANCKLYGIDPVSRALTTTIDLPRNSSGDLIGNIEEDYRPRHVAVHPSLKILACSSKKELYLVNVDKKGNNFGEYIKCHTFANHIHENGGIAFRPDGKYLFVCPEHITSPNESFKLDSFEVKYKIDDKKILVWKPKDKDNPEPKFILKNQQGSINKEEIVCILPANDGYLYVARENKDFGVIRFPMYCSAVENNSTWSGEKIAFSQNGLDGKLSSIDVSPDGTMLAVVIGESESLFVFDTRDGTRLLSKKITEISGVSNFSPNKVAFSTFSDSTQSDIYNNKNLYLTITNSNEAKDNIAYLFYLEKTNSGYELKELRNIKYSDNKGGKFTVNSPDNASVVMTDIKKPQLYFETTGLSNTEEELSESSGGLSKFMDSGEDDKFCSSIATSKRDILAVAGGKKVKLYDANTFSEIEEAETSIDKDVTSLSMNPQGDTLLVGHGVANSDGKADSTSSTDFTKISIPDLSFKNIEEPRHCLKSVFDDRTPNMAFMLELPKSSETKAFWNINDDSNDWRGSGSGDVRKDFSIDSSWKRLDMIGLPKGGAMVLYGKDDGSSMLEWIGRRNWSQDTNRGGYKLFARWTNIRALSYKIPSEEISIVVNNQIDEDTGTMVRLREKLDKSNVPTSVTLRTGFAGAMGDEVWPDSEATRYITPLILEQQDDGSFKIVSEANVLSLTKSSILTFPLTWSSFAVDDSKEYYMGWWNGGSSSNKGSIAYDVVGGGSTCISDLLISGNNKHSSLPSMSTSIDDGEWGGVTRNYAIQFISDSFSYFPPSFSKKIAISPDSGTLAIISKETNSSLYLYDFNNQIYGPETQIEGFLVDYREPCQSGVWNTTTETPSGLTTNWPKEDTSLFKVVASYTHFSDLSTEKGSLSKLSYATTKHDSWTSFNKQPGNYFIPWRADGDHTELKLAKVGNLNYTKGTANKRFFGYINSDKNFNYIQSYAGDDIRFFYNKFLIGGRYETGAGEFLENYLFAKHNNYSSDLFQADIASNKGSMLFSLFYGQEGGESDTLDHGTVPSSANTEATIIENYITVSGSSKWFSLTSLETYVLKNQPILTNTLVPSSDISDNISMFFSRDRANPVLHVLDKSNNLLWSTGRYGGDFVNEIKTLGGPVKSDLALSENGQKLFYVEESSSKNYIKSFDISVATPSLILGASATISVFDGDKYLATKPYSSYSSSLFSGGYNSIPISSDYDSFEINNNGSVTVASGGIYIFDGDRSFLCYNPMTVTTTYYSDVLKKTSLASPITTYDDCIYVFGSNNGNIMDPTKSTPTDRIQSYNTITGTALSSLDTGATVNLTQSSYQANISSYNTESVSIEDSNNNGKSYKGIKAFDDGDDCWLTEHSKTTGEITYESLTYPFLINSIKLNNYSARHGGQVGVKDFVLQGYDEATSAYEDIVTGTISKNKEQWFDFLTNSKAYKKYKFKATSSHASAHVGLRELKFYRKKVALLTPKSGWVNLNTTTNKSFQCHTENYTITVSTSDSCVTTDHFGRVTSYNYVNNLFSDNDSYWLTFNNDGTNVTNSFILFTFSDSLKVNIVRIKNAFEKNHIKKFKIYGSNETSPDSASCINPDSYTDTWTLLGEFSGLKKNTGLTPYEFDNDTAYNSYLFKILDFEDGVRYNGKDFCILSKLELWTKDASVSDNEDATENYLTPLLTDELGSVKVGVGACCASPYGLVMSGGNYDDSGSAKATGTVLLYWPHAVNKYDGQLYEYGISRSLPELNYPRMQHSMVWHKGKIYVIGGTTKLNDKSKNLANAEFIEYWDYNENMHWVATDSTKIYLNDGATLDECRRHNHASVSFGDEIFVFGGSDKDGKTKTAYAWNPDTNVIRKINNMPEALYPCSAVAFGSKIYIIGMSITSPSTLKIYEYTP